MPAKIETDDAVGGKQQVYCWKQLRLSEQVTGVLLETVAVIGTSNRCIVGNGCCYWNKQQVYFQLFRSAATTKKKLPLIFDESCKPSRLNRRVSRLFNRNPKNEKEGKRKQTKKNGRLNETELKKADRIKNENKKTENQG
ncbi:hypothetical protein [Methanolapillus africanus]|uniref:hypothetical protein n=1 Tax=Methanolapillus africanus TaxID=3028297 RepID=UPI0030B890A6